jgi:hypothetical protein
MNLERWIVSIKIIGKRKKNLSIFTVQKLIEVLKFDQYSIMSTSTCKTRQVSRNDANQYYN